MTLDEAFITGQLPKYAVCSLSLYDRMGKLIGFYVDPQAFHESVTLQ